MTRKRQYSYDSKCYDLAEYFLSYGYTKTAPEHARCEELAQAIQDTVESFPTEEPIT